MNVRVLLVDDQPLFVSGLTGLLEKESGIDVLGACTRGEDAIKAVADEKPDVVLMDISMPDMNGIEAARKILAMRPETKIIFLSIHSEERFVTAALDTGASAYLLKDSTLDQLLDAVRTVAAEGSYLSAPVASTLLKVYRARGNGGDDASPFAVLTPKERAILQLLAEGHSTRQIADHLHVSVKTVASHREHTMEKLGIHSIAGLTRYAIREGISRDND